MTSTRFDHPPDPARGPFRRIVLLVWAIALIAVCARVTVQRKHKPASGPAQATTAAPASLDPEDREGNWPRNSGYKTYVLAGRRWRDGRSLYRSLDDLSPEARQRHQAAGEDSTGREGGAWGGFRYSPTAAILFVPLSYMPGPVGEVVWRVFLLAASLGGLYWCARIGLPRPLARRDWATFFLLVLPSFTGCLNNGQSSCVIIGCLLGAIAAASTERWMLSAVLVTIPTLMKIYPLSVGMLLCVMYPRRFGWRFGLTLAIGLALPFLLRPSAMVGEHQRWLWHLLNDSKSPEDIMHMDQDLRLIVARWLNVRMSNGLFMAVQLLAAALIAAICLAGRLAGWPRRMLLARMLGLATCWMTVLGLATEPSTYILISPALAWSIWECWLRPPDAISNQRPGRSAGGMPSRVVVGGAFGLLILAYVALWFPWGKKVNTFGPEPLAGMLLFGYLIYRSVVELRSVRRPVPALAQ
jgi:hypothetical protein